MHPLNLLLINGKLTESSNYPLEIWASDKDNVRARYYAKPFRRDNKIDVFQTAKEIIGCEIAVAFDLPTPAYNIIDIDTASLSSFYTDNEIRKFHSGYKFCSKKLDNYAGFNPNVSVGFLRDYQIAGIFAFDVLMQNTDRGQRGKPNLMINDDNLLMIDHELTLSFIDNQNRKTNYENNIRVYPNHMHTLIKHMRAIKEKKHIFDEFLEYLRIFNVDSLTNIFDQMDKFNIEYGDRLDYFLYFDWCKKNIDYIKNNLDLMIG